MIEAMKRALAEAHMLLLPIPAKEVTAVDLAKAINERALKLCTFLEQAIAEAEKQEPVGDITLWTVKGHLRNHDFDYYGNLPDGTHLLYTHPPKREWVGLTPEEAVQTWEGIIKYAPAEMRVKDFAQAIEAKLKEKNS